MTPAWATIDETHDPARTSWVEGADSNPDFPIQNLPLGVGAVPGGQVHVLTAIGDHVLDLAGLSRAGLLPREMSSAVEGTTLNLLFSQPATARRALRARLSALLSEEQHRAAVEPHLHRAARVAMALPCTIGDYTDFYVGIHHAENVGRLFRPDNPLLPNYKWVPIGYHGRASSVRVSGTPVIRPNGQRKAPDATEPSVGPSRRLDYELELGLWVGEGNPLGQPIAIGEAGSHVAGVSLLNDWSARDLQAWEYQPLGPFLAKNFLTTVSPWVVTAEALAPFRTAQPPRPAGDPQPLPYLSDPQDQAHGALAITLDVLIATERMRDAGEAPHRLSRGPATSMYWTAGQILAHHSSNGCDLNPGDLIGTGTLSGPTPDSFGSLLELSRGGAEPLTLPNGETRTFLEDGDELILAGRAEREGYRAIGFGSCRGTVRPAR